MPIDPLPSISRSDANFRAQVDDYFLTQLPAFSTQAESARVQIVAAESTTTSAASTAATAAGTATSASASAVTAKNAAEAAAANAISTPVAAPIHAAASKTTPADADELGITDSAASWGLKKLTFANLKAWISSLGGAGISNTPSGNISATNVQAAINELDSEKVSKTGDTMTGQLISKKSFVNGASSSNFVAEAEGTAQGQAAGYSFRPTFTGTADNGPRRAADIWASFSGVWGTERLSFGVGVGAGNDDLNRTIERLAITGDGNVLVTGGALGYGIGSGGTAIQATSKSTAVTLNKPSGTITMHNASFAFGATVEFSLHNTMLATGDGLIVNPDGFSGYEVDVAYFKSPIEAVLRVTNQGATRSDPVVIRFCIFKGALA